MFDVELNQFKRPLQDAIRWCAGLPLISQERDSPAVAHRRTLLEEGDQLWQEAIKVAKSGSGARNTRDTEQWKAAQRIFAEVLELSGPTVNELRSSQLRPRLPTDRYPSDSDWSNAVGELIVKRSQVLKQEWTEKVSAYAKGGRILLYIPQENLADGAAQVSSGGFYDADNVPPWDVWVGFSNSALVSWVPPTLIEVAQMGIDANPENCIRWSDE
jgi:hypothetical protein